MVLAEAPSLLARPFQALISVACLKHLLGDKEGSLIVHGAHIAMLRQWHAPFGIGALQPWTRHPFDRAVVSLLVGAVSAKLAVNIS